LTCKKRNVGVREEYAKGVCDDATGEEFVLYMTMKMSVTLKRDDLRDVREVRRLL